MFRLWVEDCSILAQCKYFVNTFLACVNIPLRWLPYWIESLSYRSVNRDGSAELELSFLGGKSQLHLTGTVQVEPSVNVLIWELEIHSTCTMESV